MDKKLCFVGNLAIDDLVFADGTTRMKVPGGNSLYTVLGARLWTQPVDLISVVGNDWETGLTEQLTRSGINTSLLQSVNEATLRSWVLYEADGYRTFISRNKEILPLTPAPYHSMIDNLHNYQAYEAAIASKHRIMSPWPTRTAWESDFLYICPLRLSSQMAWLNSKPYNGQTTVALDILPVPGQGGLNHPDLLSLLAGVDIFMPSRLEASTLQDNYHPETLCRQLAARGPEIVVLKEGTQGAVVYDRRKNRFGRVPAYKTTAIDPTGAGDSFCGGFMAGLLETGDPFRAAAYGAVAASFAVENFGAMHVLQVDRATAEARLANLSPS